MCCSWSLCYPGYLDSFCERYSRQIKAVPEKPSNWRLFDDTLPSLAHYLWSCGSCLPFGSLSGPLGFCLDFAKVTTSYLHLSNFPMDYAIPHSLDPFDLRAIYSCSSYFCTLYYLCEVRLHAMPYTSRHCMGVEFVKSHSLVLNWYYYCNSVLLCPSIQPLFNQRLYSGLQCQSSSKKPL